MQDMIFYLNNKKFLSKINKFNKTKKALSKLKFKNNVFLLQNLLNFLKKSNLKLIVLIKRFVIWIILNQLNIPNKGSIFLNKRIKFDKIKWVNHKSQNGINL